jgi:hypothetical protein
MRLAAESCFSNVESREESRGMGRVLESVQTLSAILVGEIEFSWSGEREVMSHDAVDLVSHRLDGDYILLVRILYFQLV